MVWSPSLVFNFIMKSLAAENAFSDQLFLKAFHIIFIQWFRFLNHSGIYGRIKFLCELHLKMTSFHQQVGKTVKKASSLLTISIQPCLEELGNYCYFTFHNSFG